LKKIEIIFLGIWLISGLTLTTVLLISLPFIILSKIVRFLFG